MLPSTTSAVWLNAAILQADFFRIRQLLRSDITLASQANPATGELFIAERAIAGDMDSLLLLLEYGADARPVHTYFQTHPHPHLVPSDILSVIERYATSAQQRYRLTGNTPEDLLVRAVIRNQPDYLILALHQNANPKMTFYGEPILQWALRLGADGCIRDLLSHYSPEEVRAITAGLEHEVAQEAQESPADSRFTPQVTPPTLTVEELPIPIPPPPSPLDTTAPPLPEPAPTLLPQFQHREGFDPNYDENAFGNAALDSSTAQSFARLMRRYAGFDPDVEIQHFFAHLQSYLTLDGQHLNEIGLTHFQMKPARLLCFDELESIGALSEVSLARRCTRYLNQQLSEAEDFTFSAFPQSYTPEVKNYFAVTLRALKDITDDNGLPLSPEDQAGNLRTFIKMLARKETESTQRRYAEELNPRLRRVCNTGLKNALINFLANMHPDVVICQDVQATATEQAQTLGLQFFERYHGRERTHLVQALQQDDPEATTLGSLFFQALDRHILERLHYNFGISADESRRPGGLLRQSEALAICAALRYLNFPIEEDKPEPEVHATPRRSRLVG